MKVQEITCVQCPLGCMLAVEVDEGEVISVTGNTCPRGTLYGRQEALAPERVVTSLVNIEGDYHPISVKTNKPVPKAHIGDIVHAIRSCTVEPPVAIGDVVIPNILNSGIDVVATSNHE